ncbi:hypothetical protein GCM10009554_10980 [Kribbella koreensis]|uniref:Uncharacterized protein n=1 Tax=Kribbella koreensis TaxID=57909 RepID=A0ABN1PJ01_9ACTN
MDAPGELTQFVERGGELASGVGELGPYFRVLGRYRCLARAELKGKRHESLLGPVVQIAFDPAPGPVGGRDDPDPRAGQLPPSLLDRGGHGVEAALEYADLTHATAGHSCAQVAGG